jgi:glutathione peroxidase
MTPRQKILKWFYPLFVGFKKWKAKKMLLNKNNIQSPVSIYNLSVELNNGKLLPFEQLKGKKVLLVNTASDCGYTNQYADLQKLQQHSREELTIIAFPANDFKEQEKGSDEEIAKFCQVNFGVSFPLAKKSSVRKGPGQNAVFAWLTSKDKNGWNEQAPTWNFSKYLIDEEGRLAAYFDPAVEPLSQEMLNAIHH